MKAVFLDRDGVLNRDLAYVHTREAFEFLPGSLDACRKFHEAGFRLFVVTNQSGIARGYFTESDFLALSAWMKAEMAKAGAPLEGVYYCPHHPEGTVPQYRFACRCRKPAPGLIEQAAREHGIDLSRCALFGDSPRDVEAAAAAGIPERILLGKDGAAAPGLKPPATHTFKDLAAAAASPWFNEFCKRTA